MSSCLLSICPSPIPSHPVHGVTDDPWLYPNSLIHLLIESLCFERDSCPLLRLHCALQVYATSVTCRAQSSLRARTTNYNLFELYFVPHNHRSVSQYRQVIRDACDSNLARMNGLSPVQKRQKCTQSHCGPVVFNPASNVPIHPSEAPRTSVHLPQPKNHKGKVDCMISRGMVREREVL